MRRTTYRACYAKYRKNPNMRMLVNFWYDGNPSDLLLWESRFMLRRLCERAERELRYARTNGVSALAYLQILRLDRSYPARVI